jgi:hypothetical protein
MSEIWPILLMAVISMVWIMCAIDSHRLFYRFRAKYPDLARQHIPHAFDPYAHPEKFIFFFRKRSKDILKCDDGLWALREKVKFLGILSIIVPPIGFVLLVLVAFLTVQ